MKLILHTSTLLLLLVCANAQAVSWTTIPSIPTTPTTTKSTTTTTSTTSTTTEKPITTTTEQTTTTTPAPSTTTPAPTTTSPALTTTTPAATTTEEPSTTVSPTGEGSWSVKNSTGDVCIKLEMLAELAISYKIIGSDKPGQVTVKIPANATEGGNCDSEVIVLNFFDHNETPFILSLNFTSDKDTYSVANITLAYTLNNETFNNTQNPGEHVTAYLSNPVSYLKADLDHSFACAVKKDVILSSGEEATLKITDMKVQAFMKASSKGNFGDAENCDNSKSRDIVPIAVGCALVGLVVIVLIAYLIGRRRSRQQGYQSV